MLPGVNTLPTVGVEQVDTKCRHPKIVANHADIIHVVDTVDKFVVVYTGNFVPKSILLKML